MCLAVAFGSFALLVRSQTRDEGFQFKRYLRTTGNRYNGNITSLSWGKYGISLFSLVDSGMFKVPQDGPGSIGKEHSIFGGIYKTWSGSHDQGKPYGYAISTIWNKYGFYYHNNIWDGGDSSCRQISHILIPSWVPFVFSLSIGFALFLSRLRTENMAEQDVPSDGLKPSSHASSTDPTAPADAH